MTSERVSEQAIKAFFSHSDAIGSITRVVENAEKNGYYILTDREYDELKNRSSIKLATIAGAHYGEAMKHIDRLTVAVARLELDVTTLKVLATSKGRS